MGAPDCSGRSWRLKIARAQKHLVELEEHIRIYTERHPYGIGWEREGDPDSHTRRCVLRITEQPAPETAIIIGDVIHNVRSALDHLAVAIAPESQQGKAAFPIWDIDPWETASGGDYVVKDNRVRKRFERAVRGMPGEAIAIIKQLQPYSQWPAEPTGLLFYLRGDVVDGAFRPNAEGGKLHIHHPENHFLSILSRLDNADKHNDLIPVVTALPGCIVTIREKDGTVVYRNEITVPCEDGAGLIYVDSPSPLVEPHTKMDVQVRGSIHVTMRMGWPQGDADIVMALRGFTRNVPRIVFGALEPFVRPA